MVLRVLQIPQNSKSEHAMLVLCTRLQDLDQMCEEKEEMPTEEGFIYTKVRVVITFWYP